MINAQKKSKINKWSFLFLFLIFSMCFASFTLIGIKTDMVSSTVGTSGQTSGLDIYSKSDITPPSLQWTQSWGVYTYVEESMAVTTDQNNNTYTVGTLAKIVAMMPSYELFVLKYHDNGTLLWDETWDKSSEDYALGICYDENNDKVYVSGRTNSTGAGDFDALLIKYDQNGVEEWNITWGYSSVEHGNGVVVDSDGKIYVSGRTNSTEANCAGGYDATIVKFNETGHHQWNRTWGYSEDDAALGMAIDSYDNLYIVGQTVQTIQIDGFLAKYNSTGHQQWNTTFNEGTSDIYINVKVDSNNNSYVVGQILSTASLHKYNGTGSLNWTKNLTNGMGYTGYGVAIDSNGSIYMGGNGMFPAEVFLAKYNETGDKLWNFTATSTYGYEVGALAINKNDDLIVAGGVRMSNYYPNALLLKYSYDTLPDPPDNNDPPGTNPPIPGFEFPIIMIMLTGFIALFFWRKKEIKYKI